MSLKINVKKINEDNNKIEEKNEIIDLPPPAKEKEEAQISEPEECEDRDFDIDFDPDEAPIQKSPIQKAPIFGGQNKSKSNASNILLGLMAFGLLTKIF